MTGNGSQAGSHASAIEDRGLRLTVWAAVFMAALGIGFYFLTSSHAILLDGLFSGIGFFVSLLTVKVSRLVRRPDDEEFQFGYAAFEPLINLAKGLMIGAVCVFALIPAVLALFRGGRPMQGGPAVVYAAIAAAGCFAMWRVQGRRARRVNSPLLEVDMRQWLMDGAISSAVGVAFVAGWIVQRGPFAAWVDYLDPVLVIFLVGVTAHVPIGIVRENLWELLLGAPSQDVQRRVGDSLRSVMEEEGLTEYRVRMLKSGRSHLILLHVLLSDAVSGPDVAELDRIRSALGEALPPAIQPATLDVVFTRDRTHYDQGTIPRHNKEHRHEA